MLAAHLDVVPVETQVWDYPQFKAHIEDGFIYGRGTIDNKQSVMVIFYSYFKILIVLALPFRTDSDITNTKFTEYTSIIILEYSKKK